MREGLEKFEQKVRHGFLALTDQDVKDWGIYYDRGSDRLYCGIKGFSKERFYIPIGETGISALIDDAGIIYGSGIPNFRFFAERNPEFLFVFPYVDRSAVDEAFHMLLDRFSEERRKLVYAVRKNITKFLSQEKYPVAMPLPSAVS